MGARAGEPHVARECDIVGFYFFNSVIKFFHSSVSKSFLLLVSTLEIL